MSPHTNFTYHIKKISWLTFTFLTVLVSISPALAAPANIDIRGSQSVPTPISLIEAVKPVLSDSVAQASVLEAYVSAQAKLFGVNPVMAVFVAGKESQWNVNALGDHNHSRGLFQISNIYHPEVSDACAFDYKCATQFFLKQVLAGKVAEWSTWKFCSLWYPDCYKN